MMTLQVWSKQIKGCEWWENDCRPSEFLAAIRSEAAGYYRVLVARKADLYGRYLKGWLNRAYA